MKYRVAADIGGTFTDIVLLAEDGRFATSKISSTPSQFEKAVIDGIDRMLRDYGMVKDDISEVLHACTVATNAILEQKGARTAFVATKGFRDLLELRRIRVPQLYNPLYVKPPDLVPRNLCFEVDERLDFEGRVLVPLTQTSLARLVEALRDARVDAVAVCLINSYANPVHEREVGDYLKSAMPDCFVTLSIDVLPEIREYERASTTVINAYVGPPVSQYLGSLAAKLKDRGIVAPLRMMQSSGGIIDALGVLATPAQIVECGPAAGVMAAAHLSRMAGYGNLVTFDMGGTTAKASIVENGSFLIADEYEVGGGISLSSRLVKGGGYALKLPAIDISEVGAGGGSIVWIDKAGAMKVGPRSAGAVPGPACYGAGNTEPTVTDANVALGYLNPHALAGGTVPIDRDLSLEAIENHVGRPLNRSVLEAAFGIHSVTNTNMMRAIQSVTTYKGRDPRGFAILAFGGNGGIHSVALAKALRIGKIIVPNASGVFSALGLLFVDVELTLTQGFVIRTDKLAPFHLESRFDELEKRCARQMGYSRAAVRFRRFLDLRYLGQAFELTVPFNAALITESSIRDVEEAFEAEHERSHGHRMTGSGSLELVNLRVTGSVPSAVGRELYAGHAIKISHEATGTDTRDVYFGPEFGTHRTPILSRNSLSSQERQGPIIVEEYDGTVVVPPDCLASLDPLMSIVIRIGAHH